MQENCKIYERFKFDTFLWCIGNRSIILLIYRQSDLKESDLSGLRSKKNVRPNSNSFGKIVEFDLKFGFYIFWVKNVI